MYYKNHCRVYLNLRRLQLFCLRLYELPYMQLFKDGIEIILEWKRSTDDRYRMKSKYMCVRCTLHLTFESRI